MVPSIFLDMLEKGQNLLDSEIIDRERYNRFFSVPSYKTKKKAHCISITMNR